MKRIALIFCTLCLVAACTKSPVARISATIEGAPDSSIVLKKLNLNKFQTVDTIKTDASGKLSYKVKLTGNEPYFYYLFLGENPVASLVLLPSDNVKVNVSADGYQVEGSEESALLKQVNDAFAKASEKLTSIASKANDDLSDEEYKAINSQLSKLYIDYKRDAVKYVIEHPYSITSAVVLFQKFNDNLQVFDEPTDAILLKRAQDSLATVYPKSEFLTALRDAVTAREKVLDLNTKMSAAKVSSFPDLVMPDINGQMRNLSEFEGNAIIVSFWSVSQTEHKMFNHDLLTLYEKYHDRGLQIYQVGLDVDKASWASVVKSQNLPWVSVNDGYGVASPSITAYNVDHIPAMFVIDSKGEIVGMDVFDTDRLDALVRQSL